MTMTSTDLGAQVHALASDRAAITAIVSLGGVAATTAAMAWSAGAPSDLASGAARAVFAAGSAAFCLAGVRQVTCRDERRFWVWLAMSLLVVFVAEAISLGPTAGSRDAVSFMGRSLLVLAYACLMAGVARFAGGSAPGGASRLSAWTRPGLLMVMTSGWLAYAAVLPFVDPVRSMPPQWDTFLILDVVIVGGFVGIGRADRSRRWLALRRWLVWTFVLALATNLVAGVFWSSPAGPIPPVAVLCWLGPHLGVILAARLRHHLPDSERMDRHGVARRPRPPYLPDASLLVLAAFSLPVAHTVAQIAGHAPVGTRSPQDFVVAVSALLLGVFAAVEYRAMDAARTALARERHDAERALLQAQRMEAIGRLGGGIAHDFNNLLTAIGGYADLVRDGLPPSDPTSDAMARVLVSVDRASSLTQQLLAVGRRQHLRAGAVDVNDVVRDLPVAHRHLLTDRIELVPDLAADLQRAWVDPAQFEQAFVNLVVNARDAMASGGVLRVTTRNVEFGDGATVGWPESKAGRYVRIEVADAGVGIADEALPRVFEPFFTTKPQGSGTGLGLAIVYGIVRQSGGRIALTSRVGHGTTVTIDLPAAAEARTATVPVAGPAPPVGTETILVAEDERAVRDLVQAMLSIGGYRVLAAGSGEEALHVARKHDGPVHLLLTDVVMPGMNGRELAERLMRERPDARVLYMSGYTDDMSVRMGVLEGVVALLPKPFTRQALLDAVRGALDAGSRTARPHGGVS